MVATSSNHSKILALHEASRECIWLISMIQHIQETKLRISLPKNGEIDVQKIHSSDNLVDLFTKALPTSTFRKLGYKIGMRQPKEVDMRESPL